MDMAATASRPSVPWLALGLLLGAVVALQVVRDRATPPPADAAPMLWVQSPELARRMTLSFDDLAADVYWIRAVVQYGSDRRTPGAPNRFALLYPLLDMTLTLDPNFDVAARLGAVFLSEGYPGGPGQPDRAIALLEKGMAHNPTRWQYAHDIGFVYYWWLKDYKKAAEYFDKASALPGAPNWLKSLAGTTLLVGGDRESARTLWNELYQTADVDWLRRTAETRLAQLRALDEIDMLEERVAAAASRLGRPPASWAEVVATGALGGVPLDPAGTPYAIGADGHVALSEASPLSPLPTIGVHR
jgi:tetratricopeptide (TPR) repeat protein